MSNFGNSRIQRARKQYRCEECNRKILPGDQYEYHFGIWEGERFTNRACLHCAELRKQVNEVDGFYYEGYYGGLPQWIEDRNWTELRYPVTDSVNYVTLLRGIVGYRLQWRSKNGDLWPVPRVPAS